MLGGMNGGPRWIAALAGAIVTSALLGSIWAGVAAAGKNAGKQPVTPGQIEICKSGDNGALGQQFNFTITNNSTNQAVQIAGGSCSAALSFNPGSYTITEDLSGGLWQIKSIAVQPDDAWLSETDKKGMVKVTVTAGQETQVSYTDAGAPGTFKVCKWSASPSLQGKQYTFTIGTQTVTAIAGSSPGSAMCSGLMPEQPGTRLTVTENVPAGLKVVSTTAGGAANITSSANGVVKVTTGVGVNIVTFENEPVGPPQTGFVEICKDAADDFVSGTFHFELSDQNGQNLDANPGGTPATGEDILVGQCSGPIKVPAGPVIVTELPNPNTQVAQIWAADPSTLGLTNLINGSATVVVPVSTDGSNEVLVHFVNKTLTSQLKICKLLPAGSEALAGKTFTFDVTDDAYPDGAHWPVQIVASAGVNGACKIVADKWGHPVVFPIGSTVTATEMNSDPFVSGDGNPAGTPDVQTLTIGPGVVNPLTFSNTALGQLEICKRMLNRDDDLGQLFTLNYVNAVNSKIKGTVKIAAGACSLPQVVPAGNYILTEDLSKLTVNLGNGVKAQAFAFAASDARGPIDDNRCVPQQSTADNYDLPVVGRRSINTNCGNPLTVSVPYFNSTDPIKFGETTVTVWNKLVRSSVKLCKVVTSDSMASLSGTSFHFTWSAASDGSAHGSADLTPGTCSGIMGSFPIAISDGMGGLAPNKVTVKETTPTGIAYVSSATLTGGQPVSGYTTGNTPAQGSFRTPPRTTRVRSRTTQRCLRRFDGHRTPGSLLTLSQAVEPCPDDGGMTPHARSVAAPASFAVEDTARTGPYRDDFPGHASDGAADRGRSRPPPAVSCAARSRPARSARSMVALSHLTFVSIDGENESTSSLAARVQAAGGAVQSREREALDGAVDAAAGEGRLRRAGVGELRLPEGDRPEGELDDEEHRRGGADGCEGEAAPARRHGVPQRRTRIGTSAASAKSAESRNASRKLRVRVAWRVPIRSSRTWRRSASCWAPRLSKGSFRSGTTPFGALSSAFRRSSATGTFWRSGTFPSRMTRVPARRAFWPPRSRSCVSRGAISARAATSPRGARRWSSCRRARGRARVGRRRGSEPARRARGRARRVRARARRAGC